MVMIELNEEEFKVIDELRRTIHGANDYIIFDDHAEMVLRDKKGKERNRTKVSLHRVEELININWYSSGNSYVSGKVSNDDIMLHRFIMKAKHDEMVDHINHDKFDNIDKNIRICTRSENMMNTITPIGNKSGFKGVMKDSRDGKWRAYITINKKQKHLGSFINYDDAVQARINANIKYQGEFAYGKDVV